MARPLTYDQIKEMTEHELFTHEKRIQVYLAHPHSPWKRGANENTNELISASASLRARAARGSRVVRSRMCKPS
jgi:hypothetical protein